MIYVDGLAYHADKGRLTGLWCHMATDDPSPAGLEKLHRIAERIGLRRSWFQNHHLLDHYDLRPKARARALLQTGEVEEVSRTELLRRCSPRYREMIAGDDRPATAANTEKHRGGME